MTSGSLAHAPDGLRRDRPTVGQPSAQLGHESEASFSRAFKRFIGVPPSALRQTDGAIVDARDLSDVLDGYVTRREREH